MVLTRTAPAELNVDAARILTFLDAVRVSGMEFHSLMILRHGAVVAEGWWAPYRQGDVHLMHSLSKTFTAMAVGIAVGEGLFSTQDLVADLLPDLVPAQLPDHLRQLRVRHLLSMASGHRDETLGRIAGMGPDPVRNFLSLVPEEPPGGVFAYNQGNPLTLSQIITTVTGQRMIDYLRPRLLDPLGIERAEWTAIATGIDQGYSGLHVTTEAAAKLGQLILRNGRWGAVQLVPSGYVAECRRRHIDTVGWSGPDWQQGYGYLMWMCRHGAQRGDGAFGQFVIALPDPDAVIACTARIDDMQAQLDLIWDHLLPAFGDSPPPRPADPSLAEQLKQLSITPLAAARPGPGRPVELWPADMDAPFDELIEHARVEPLPGGTRLILTVHGDEHAFDLPDGQWASGVLPGLSAPFPEVSVSGGWAGEDEYHADVIWRCAPHRLRLRARLGSRPRLSGRLLGALLFPI